MCNDENWSAGSLIAVVVAVLVALGWLGSVDAEQTTIPALLGGASLCLDQLCVRL